MSLYEQGFTEGETAGFHDGRQRIPRRVRPDGDLGEFSRGWWDGYCPRSLLWSLRNQPSKAVSEVDA
jgi:hypothetical protein